MSNEFRIIQTFSLVDSSGDSHVYQNYYTERNDFAPFQVEGSVSALGGDNSQIQVLFPATKYAIKLVEKGSGNRKSQLTLTTNFITSNEQVGSLISKEIYIGIGASFSESTIELRFNTAVDAVASNFPAQQLNEENVGILPLDSSLSLR
jgi:hypothetical protein